MNYLIRSYSDQPPEILKDSKVYAALQSSIDTAYDNNCFNIKEKTFKELQSLFGEKLTRQAASTMLQPWSNAIRIAAIVENIDIEACRKKYARQARYIDTMIRDLERGISSAEQLLFFLEGYELNHELMIEYFEAYKRYFLPMLELKFLNGATLNPHNIRRHGIFSLFHLGERLGLQKTGKPYPLHHFIHIATGKEYKNIDDYSLQYNKEEFENTSANHLVYKFIYNPEEPINLLAEGESII